MLPRIVVLLYGLFSTLVFAGVERLSPTSFIYINGGGLNPITVHLNGYIKQENIHEKTIEAAARRLADKKEGIPVALTEISISSTIKRVYTINISSSEATSSSLGIQPGIGFIIYLDDGRYLLAFLNRQRVHVYTEPQKVQNTILDIFEKAMKSPFGKPTIIPDSEPLVDILSDSGSVFINESGVDVLVVTILHDFKIAGIGSIHLGDEKVDYQIQSSTEWPDNNGINHSSGTSLLGWSHK